MSSWQVYILRCADGTLYTGITNRLPARLETHNGGRGAKYTRGRRPVVLVWRTSCKSHGAALSLEHAIKQLTRPRKEVLIVATGSARKRMLARLKAKTVGKKQRTAGTPVAHVPPAFTSPVRR